MQVKNQTLVSKVAVKTCQFVCKNKKWNLYSKIHALLPKNRVLESQSSLFK